MDMMEHLKASVWEDRDLGQPTNRILVGRLSQQVPGSWDTGSFQSSEPGKSPVKPSSDVGAPGRSIVPQTGGRSQTPRRPLELQCREEAGMLSSWPVLVKRWGVLGRALASGHSPSACQRDHPVSLLCPLGLTPLLDGGQTSGLKTSIQYASQIVLGQREQKSASVLPVSCHWHLWQVKGPCD